MDGYVSPITIIIGNLVKSCAVTINKSFTTGYWLLVLVRLISWGNFLRENEKYRVRINQWKNSSILYNKNVGPE